ncbi:MAG TPA: H(+)/Cl(-) exchange transporter ClcA [Bacillota bacterium]|nr:H(+)/Cl(-) exchange transporter ClcA [Bacillota bacterium]HPW40358.1 H(+)/Cl(-) exchange transporter ClcA [Bacillota bacterium]
MEENNINSTFNTINHWNNFKLKLVFEGVIVGAFSGLAVVLYRYLIELAGHFSRTIYMIQKGNNLFIPLWLVVLIFLGYFTGVLIKEEPMVSGSGIPQVEGVLLRYFNMNWWRTLLGKLVGGFISILAGLSLGREGPSIQIGAAIAKGYSEIFKKVKLEEKFLITSGASAGLAAAFNAPLAGVMFSLEEVHKNFSPVVLVSAMAASITADVISKCFFGFKPVFNLQSISSMPLNNYIFVIILGMIMGVFGTLFNYILLKTQDLYNAQKWLPQHMRPIIPFIMAGILGLILPEVLGGGHELVSSMVDARFTTNILLIILVTKFIFTMISYGSGAPGGIFLPLLVIGALIGDIFGNTISNAFNFSPEYIKNLIILAMAGYFTAVVRAPITGIILITEMTGSFNHLLSVSIVSAIAYVTADILGSKPIYESLLDRMVNKESSKFRGDSKTKVIIETAVCMGSLIEGKKIKELKLPSECLLVAVKRGKHEIIPKGDTQIHAGDYLITLTNEDNASEIREKLTAIAEVLSASIYEK